MPEPSDPRLPAACGEIDEATVAAYYGTDGFGVQARVSKMMVKNSRHTHLVATGLCLSALFVALSAAAQPPSKEDEIRQKYRQAAALVAEKKPAEAKKLFLEIWAQSKSYDVAASLGQIEYAWRNYTEAARYLSYAVAHYPPHQSDKQLEALKKWLEDAKKHVAAYEIDVKVKGALISIDGVDVGTAPLEGPIYLAPGKHLLMVTAAGYKRLDRTLNGAEGGLERLELALDAVETPAVAATAAPVAPAPIASVPVQTVPVTTDYLPPERPNPWILVGGGVVTVGGLVAGLVFNAKANSAKAEARSIADRVGPRGCSDGGTADARDCAELSDFNRSHDRDRNISTVALAVGGAALVGTVAYWLWPRPKTQPRAMEGQLNVSLSQQGSWLGVSGRF